MYDELTRRYTFACPTSGDVRVRLSRFRNIDRLEGASHPAVFKVSFECPCGQEHDGLVAHDELDWAPLGGAADAFFNVMTQRLESAAAELLELAARQINAGAWPWSFFCFPEGRARPVFPSAFRVLAPAQEQVGLAVTCPGCSHTTVNLVSPRHVDEPFYNDRRVGVVEHVFEADRDGIVARFREELDSSSFDARRREL